MSGKHGGVQREGRQGNTICALSEPPIAPCSFHALSEGQAVQDFFEVCNGLYNFFANLQLRHSTTVKN